MDEGLEYGPLTGIRTLGGGTQNIMLRFTCGTREFVLRRGPLHPRARTDDNLRREMRLPTALSDTAVPHARLVAACPDESVLGESVFYLMEQAGQILRTRLRRLRRIALPRPGLGGPRVAPAQRAHRWCGIGDRLKCSCAVGGGSADHTVLGAYHAAVRTRGGGRVSAARGEDQRADRGQARRPSPACHVQPTSVAGVRIYGRATVVATT